MASAAGDAEDQPRAARIPTKRRRNVAASQVVIHAVCAMSSSHKIGSGKSIGALSLVSGEVACVRVGSLVA